MNCPHCGAELALPEAARAGLIACSRCGGQFAPEGSEAPAVIDVVATPIEDGPAHMDDTPGEHPRLPRGAFVRTFYAERQFRGGPGCCGCGCLFLFLAFLLLVRLTGELLG